MAPDYYLVGMTGSADWLILIKKFVPDGMYAA